MSGPWDAARAASKRSVRKYKPVAPVGAKLLEHPQLGMQRHFGGVYDLRSCAGCGYHVCSCELQSPHVDDSAWALAELRRLKFYCVQALMDTPLGSTEREAITLLITGQPPKDEP